MTDASPVVHPSDAAAATGRAEVPLRLAVVGCGAVTERYHLPALLASNDVEIVAFIDPTISRAQALAAGVSKAVATDSHHGLAGRVDLAVVAVPNAWHERIAVDLLQQGVHVLVEKPMARSVEECDRMWSAAKSGSAVLAVGQDFRFFPLAQFAHRFFASGLLGSILRVDVRQSAGVRWPCLSAAALAPESGGGALMSFGVHTLDLLLWWFGDMQVRGYRDDARGGVEAECECELELETGAPVHVEVSRRRPLRDTAIIECERGSLEIGIHEPALVRLTIAPDVPAIDAQVPDAVFERAPLQTVFGRQLADVVAAIRAGAQPLVGAAEGRRVVALVQACYAQRQPLRRSWDYPQVYDALSARVQR